MTTTGTWLYPHDLTQLPDLLSTVREAALDTVCVAVRYHSLLAVAPTNPVGRIVELPHTATYFAPDEALWRNRALRPAVSPFVAEVGDAIDLGREFCDRAGTTLTAWIVGLHSDRLVRDRPDLAVETVTGDRLAGAPCLSSLEVQDFAVRLVRDVAARVDAVQLESMTWTAQPHARHTKVEGAAPNLSRLALSLCFCRRCRDRSRRGDVDADAVAEQLLRRWAAAWDGCGADDPASVPGLDGYLALRQSVVTELLGAIVAACPVPVEVVQFGDPQLTGTARRAAESVGASVRVLTYGGATDVERAFDSDQLSVGGVGAPHVGLSILPEHAREQIDIERAITAAADRGVASVRFYHAGLAGPRRRAWLPALAQAWRSAAAGR
jgi:hypothetical protein